MELLPHQIEDADFLADRKFAGCFSGMGSGKTLTALEAYRRVSRSYVKKQLCVIVGPPISLTMWQREFERHVKGRSQILKTGKMKIDPKAVCLIMSYEIATKRAAFLVRDFPPDVLICDESHALKNHKAKRTKAILGRGGLCSVARHTWMLTGTPSTRWNDDLFPFLCRADLKGLGAKVGRPVSYDRFRLKFCVTQRRTFPGAKYPTDLVVGNRNTDELHDWLYHGFRNSGALAVRRELAEVWKAMPPLTTNRYDIPLKWRSKEDAEMMRRFEKMSVSQAEAELREQRQKDEESLSTIRRKLGLAKLDAAVGEIAARLDADPSPLLVGAWHTEVIDELSEALECADKRVSVIDGRSSGTYRELAQCRFNERRLDVLIGQIAAMGVSLNLQHGGNRILVVEEDWSPAIMDQFYARLHRIGQTEHVHVDILQSDTKLEKALARINATKRREHRKLNEQEMV